MSTSRAVVGGTTENVVLARARVGMHQRLRMASAVCCTYDLPASPRFGAKRREEKVAYVGGRETYKVAHTERLARYATFV